METIKMNKLACGKHWSASKPVGADCDKCVMHAEQRESGHYQRRGVPWVAVLGEAVEKPEWWGK